MVSGVFWKGMLLHQSRHRDKIDSVFGGYIPLDKTISCKKFSRHYRKKV